uniref:RING-type domain-containing protein n=1 Tax=viral metagenome TaxID=1070528 RepID=A0A6C0DXL1_9ZZZZ
MTCVITNYLLSEIFNTQNIEKFYKTLTTRHYYCEDDFKLKTNYAILLFVDTLFLDKVGGYKGLIVPHNQQCDLYQYIAENRLKIFHYVTFKASAHNDLTGLQLLIDEFKKDNWIVLFGHYLYDKTLDLLSSKEDCFDIKNKIYAIICSLKEAQVIKVELLCDACENDCPICLDTMDITNSITTLCKHSFHSKCLYPMFDEAVKQNSTRPKISCPLCRADVFIKSKITFKEIVNY